MDCSSAVSGHAAEHFPGRSELAVEPLPSPPDDFFRIECLVHLRQHGAGRIDDGVLAFDQIAILVEEPGPEDRHQAENDRHDEQADEEALVDHRRDEVPKRDVQDAGHAGSSSGPTSRSLVRS